MNNIERIIKDAKNLIINKINEVKNLGELESLHLELLGQVTKNCIRMCENGYTQKEADEVEVELNQIIDNFIGNKRFWIIDEMKSNFKFEFSF